MKIHDTRKLPENDAQTTTALTEIICYIRNSLANNAQIDLLDLPEIVKSNKKQKSKKLKQLNHPKQPNLD